MGVKVILKQMKENKDICALIINKKIMYLDKEEFENLKCVFDLYYDYQKFLKFIEED